MDAFTTRLSHTLRETLTDAARDASDKLVIAVEPDYASYRERVGYVKGVRYALEALAEVEMDLGRADSAGKENQPIYKGQRYED